MSEGARADLHELLREVRKVRLDVSSLAADLLAGGFRSQFQGAGIEFDEVREYVPGDDPRSIDWNVTARVGTPYIKKYVDERERTLMLLLDLSPSMEAGFGAWSLRDAAVRLAAAWVIAAQTYDDPVGWVAFGGEVAHAVPPRKGTQHGFGVVRDAMRLPQAGAGLGLADALSRANQLLRRRATIVVLSDFLQSGWEDPLALCARRHDVIALPLMPPEYHDLPRARMRLRPFSGKGMQVVDGRNEAVRALWQEEVRALLVGWRERFQRAGVESVPVDVPSEPSIEALAAPLQTFLARRKRRRQSG